MTSRIFAGVLAVVCIVGVIAATVTRDEDPPTVVSAGAGPTAGETAEGSADDMATAESAVSAEETTVATQEAAAPNDPLLPTPENHGAAGTLVNLDGWLQTDATSLEDFEGEVKVLQFWTFSCHNCTATIPHLQALYENYHADGLEIIGVHAPEFSFEEDPDAVLEAAQDLGVTWPIAIDNQKRNFRTWQGSRRFWPRTYVIDANGDIRFDHIGEGAYDELEETVAYLIQNGGA